LAGETLGVIFESIVCYGWCGATMPGGGRFRGIVCRAR
jgi:hypothetical protein